MHIYLGSRGSDFHFKDYLLQRRTCRAVFKHACLQLYKLTKPIKTKGLPALLPMENILVYKFTIHLKYLYFVFLKQNYQEIGNDLAF